MVGKITDTKASTNRETSGNGLVTIEALGHRGDGIGYLGKQPIYIPATAPGDTVRYKATKSFGNLSRGNVVSIEAASPMRVEPPCPHFIQCGGCALQHIAPEAYRSWKTNLILDALRYQNVASPTVDQLIAVPPSTRRRVVFSVIRTKSNVSLGYFERSGKTIVDVASCKLVTPRIEALLAPVREAFRHCLKPKSRAAIYILDSETGLDLAIDTKAPPSLEAREAFGALSRNHEIARVTWISEREGDEPLVIKNDVMVSLGDYRVSVPPKVFLQASLKGEAAIVSAVETGLGHASKVADLYAGCGTLSLSCRSIEEVLAIDVNGPHLDALEAASSPTTKRKISIERRNLNRRPLTTIELDAFEAVILDPPRAGAEAQCRKLAKSNVPKVIMVSCDPSTFSRDARILTDGGYRLTRLTPIDQFVWSAHLELVGIFSRDPD